MAKKTNVLSSTGEVSEVNNVINLIKGETVKPICVSCAQDIDYSTNSAETPLLCTSCMKGGK